MAALPHALAPDCALCLATAQPPPPPARQLRDSFPTSCTALATCLFVLLSSAMEEEACAAAH